MNSVYIDSAVAATPIYIGPTNATSVVIGNANSNTNINGLLNANISTSNIDVAPAGTLNIGSSITTGSLTIGQGNVTTGSIYIGAGNGGLHTGPIVIGTTGTGATGTATTIQGGTTTIESSPGGTINIGMTQTASSSSINIGGNTNRLGTINIGGSGSGNINLGNTNCSTIVNGPLVMGTGKNIILQPATGFVIPNVSTQLGNIISATIPAAWPGSQANGSATLTVSPGVWLFTFNIYFTNTTATTNYLYTSESKYYGLTQLQGGSGWISSGTFVNSYTTTTTVGLSNYFNNAAVSDTNSFFKAVRIA